MRNKVEYMNNAPIGIFDSGLGGLTVARAVIDKLPDEEIVYLGDTEHTPYGPRAIAQVRSLTLSALDELAFTPREGARHRLQHGDGRRARGRPGTLLDRRRDSRH